MNNIENIEILFMYRAFYIISDFKQKYAHNNAVN